MGRPHIFDPLPQAFFDDTRQVFTHAGRDGQFSVGHLFFSSGERVPNAKRDGVFKNPGKTAGEFREIIQAHIFSRDDLRAWLAYGNGRMLQTLVSINPVEPGQSQTSTTNWHGDYGDRNDPRLLIMADRLPTEFQDLPLPIPDRAPVGFSNDAMHRGPINNTDETINRTLVRIVTVPKKFGL